jgi:hypothetical protein
MEERGGLWIFGEFPALGRKRIRVEHNAVRVAALHQHHAHVRQAVGAGGGDRHGVRIVRLGGFRLLEPFSKQGKWVQGLRKVTSPLTTSAC